MTQDVETRTVVAPFEELPEDLMGGFLPSAALDQNSQAVAVQSDGPPEIGLCPIVGEEDFSQRRRLAALGTSASPWIGLR